MLAGTLLLALTGCATTFSGKPKIEGGPAACSAICEGWGMQLAGMVQMGEYSSGCVCEVKGGDFGSAPRAAAAALPAVAGVWTQMQRSQQQPQSGAAGSGYRPGMR